MDTIKCYSKRFCFYCALLALFAASVLLVATTGCVGDLDVEGKECDPAHPCPEGYVCLPAVSEDKSVCFRAGDLCESDADCASAVCVSGACVVEPDVPCRLDLECYSVSPEIPPTGDNCSIDGLVVSWFGPPGDIMNTSNLMIRVHRLDRILDGDTGNPEAVVEAGGMGEIQVYVPVNENLVFEVQEGSNSEGVDFATMYTFGIYLRADECGINLQPLEIPAITLGTYEIYSNAFAAAEPARGIVLGRILDCNSYPLSSGTGGISMDHEVLFYVDSNGAPQDPADLSSTSDRGLFAAVNVEPTQGVASALVKEDSTEILSLHTRWVRAFPGAASLVLFGPPKKHW